MNEVAIYSKNSTIKAKFSVFNVLMLFSHYPFISTGLSLSTLYQGGKRVKSLVLNKLAILKAFS